MIHRIPYKYFILPVVLVILWQFLGMGLPEKSRVPIPSKVLISAKMLVLSGDLGKSMQESLSRVTIGFLIAASLALLFGLLTGYFPSIGHYLEPIVEIFRPVAPIALLPLAILWFGTGTLTSIFIVAWAAFFPAFINTVYAVRGIDLRIIQAAQTMGISKPRILSSVIIPAAMPSIFVGLRLGLGFSWMSIIAAEMAVGAKGGSGSTGGIGNMMFVFTAYHIELNSIVVCMISVGIVALLIDRSLRWMQRKIMPWAKEIN
jgi:ABC-type nitrate/sulfonate/bicarbonate transport system permease component